MRVGEKVGANEEEGESEEEGKSEGYKDEGYTELSKYLVPTLVRTHPHDELVWYTTNVGTHPHYYSPPR